LLIIKKSPKEVHSSIKRLSHPMILAPLAASARQVHDSRDGQQGSDQGFHQTPTKRQQGLMPKDLRIKMARAFLTPGKVEKPKRYMKHAQRTRT
jgi:hypothetical protein